MMTNGKSNGVSRGGVRAPAMRIPDLHRSLEAHVERHIGPIAQVMQPRDQGAGQIEVLIVAPTAARPSWTLITTGMSDHRMAGAPRCECGTDCFGRAELVLGLPASWPMTPAAMRAPATGWPISMLIALASYPMRQQSWFASGHTIASPPQMACQTRFTAVLMTPPLGLDGRFDRALLPGGICVNYLATMPLYPEELDFKRRRGADALIDRFQALGISEVVSAERPSAVARSPEPKPLMH